MIIEKNFVSKIRSLLKQFIREWSEEGSHERNISYEPLKREV